MAGQGVDYAQTRNEEKLMLDTRHILYPALFDCAESYEPHALKRTRKRKAKNVSDYRQSKLAAHRTVNGKGCVARLMRK